MLSDSVSKALSLTGGPEASETARFAGMFDKFFDCLNVRNYTHGIHSRKFFQMPYTHGNDSRLQVNSSSSHPKINFYTCTVDRECFSSISGRMGDICEKS